MQVPLFFCYVAKDEILMPIKKQFFVDSEVDILYETGRKEMWGEWLNAAKVFA